MAAAVVGGMLSAATIAEAQTTQRGAPTPTTPRLVVVNFRSPDKAVGMAAADAVRDRLMREYSARETWVITRKDIDNFLESSGYPVDEALSPTDAAALARQMRAEQFVDGTITPQPDGQFRVDARVVLMRSAALAQPLPPQMVARPQDAAQAIARDVKEARRHLGAEDECYRAAGNQRWDEARAAAYRGIQAYPRSTITRLCLANVLAAQEPPKQDSILVLAEEVLAIDPRSRPALQLKYNAQVALGQNEPATNTLTEMLAADPSNTDLQNRVVNQLAADRQFERAAGVIRTALAENQGDPDLMRTAFLVFSAAEQWQEAVTVGEQLGQMNDTTLDRNFYLRLASAHIQTQQPQKAGEVISRGIARFPQDAELLVGAASIYREAGQLQQGIEMLRRGLATNPRAPQGNLVLAELYADLNQPDSALTALRAAQAAGDSAGAVAGVAAQIAQRAFDAGRESTNLDEFVRAITFAGFADSVAPGNPYKFLQGTAAFFAVQQELQQAQQTQSCDLARAAKDHLAIINRTIPVAGSVSPETAQQIMGAAQQWAPFPDQMIAAYCRGG